MKKEKKEKHFIQKPVYPGGPTAMKKFVKTHLTYPKEARKNEIEGTVTLRYTINHHGDVIDTKIIKQLGFGCNEEAIRVVKLFKFRVEKTYKQKVLFHKTINIHFNLPPPPKVKHRIVYHYQNENENTSKSVAGYNYTIDITTKI